MVFKITATVPRNDGCSDGTNERTTNLVRQSTHNTTVVPAHLNNVETVKFGTAPFAMYDSMNYSDGSHHTLYSANDLPA